jgi:hypothetical protein
MNKLVSDSELCTDAMLLYCMSYIIQQLQRSEYGTPDAVAAAVRLAFSTALQSNPEPESPVHTAALAVSDVPGLYT